MTTTPAARSGADPDARHHQVLAGASRAAVLDVLRSSEAPLGVAELADAVGLHANTVRAHLDTLLEAGYVVRRTEPPRGPGRPRVVFEATAAPEDGRNYRMLAELLARYLVATTDRPGEAAVAAGRQFAVTGTRGTLAGGGPDGEAHFGAGPARSHVDVGDLSAEEAVRRLVRLLADAGFAPEASADGTQISLHHCPFRELAETQRDVVCGAHLGLIQGALEDLGAPVEATRLLPFVEPDLCVTTLAPLPAHDAAAPGSTHDTAAPLPRRRSSDSSDPTA